MRVLIVHNQLWAHYKSKLFSELHKLSSHYDIQLFVVQIALSEKSRTQMGEAETTRYDYPYEVLFPTSLDHVSLWRRTTALLRALRAYRPQVLNLTGYYDPAQWVLLLYAKLMGIRVIISNESNIRDHVRGGVKEAFKRWLLSLADGFFCFGESSAKYLELLGVSPSKILSKKAAIVDNDVLLKHYHKAIGQRDILKKQKGWAKYNFIFVGRLIPPKNLSMLLESFAKVQAEDWGLVLLGEGDLKTALQYQSADLGLKNVCFEAGVPWYEVAEYMALANVLVLPSTSEPWGLVVNEAMLCGLPVLVSEVCGCVEDLVRTGYNGFTFNPSHSTDLTLKIKYFVENVEQLPRMGEASRQLVATFEPTQVAHQMLRGIQSLGR